MRYCRGVPSNHDDRIAKTTESLRADLVVNVVTHTVQNLGNLTQLKYETRVME